MARPRARSGYPRSKIKFFNEQWPWCSNRFTSRTFWTVPTGFGPVGRRTRRWRSGETSSWNLEAGDWKVAERGRDGRRDREVSRGRHPAGWGDLTTAGEHLLA